MRTKNQLTVSEPHKKKSLSNTSSQMVTTNRWTMPMYGKEKVNLKLALELKVLENQLRNIVESSPFPVMYVIRHLNNRVIC